MKKRALSIFLALLLTLSACGTGSSAADVGTTPPTPSTQAVALSGAVEGFTDIPADAQYAQSVTWCREKGLLNGVGEGRFDPEGSLTRAMLATALYRAAGEPASEGRQPFVDTEAGAWYTAAVAWAGGKGLIRGYGDGRFGPEDPVSVEQLEVIVGRYTGGGPAWTGDPAKAQNATRAQVAVALYDALTEEDAPTQAGSRVLVAYFSATGNTRPLAQYAAEHLNADLFELLPAQPYTQADLAYYTDCRADREQNDPNARPAIAEGCVVEDMAAYDVVLLGYPIWHGQAPRLLYTFLESYDFTGKTILSFCTSGSSGLGSSADALQALTPGAAWLEGRRFAAGTSREEVEEWLDGLPLTAEGPTSVTLSFNGHSYTATLEDNSSAAAFAALLEEGPLTVSTHDYGSFEKVGPLGTSLPRNDSQITTSPGDIILYQGDQITVYYAPNTWSFTRLGHIDDPTGLQEALGDGDVEITFRLADPTE